MSRVLLWLTVFNPSRITQFLCRKTWVTLPCFPLSFPARISTWRTKDGDRCSVLFCQILQHLLSIHLSGHTKSHYNGNKQVKQQRWIYTVYNAMQHGMDGNELQAKSCWTDVFWVWMWTDDTGVSWQRIPSFKTAIISTLHSITNHTA